MKSFQQMTDAERLAAVSSMTPDERAALLAAAHLKVAAASADAGLVEKAAIGARRAAAHAELQVCRLERLSGFLARHGIDPSTATLGEMMDFLHPDLLPAEYWHPERLPSDLVRELPGARPA